MAILKRAQSSISGLTQDLININQAITAETQARQTADGDLTTLATTAKASLVAAINEVFATAGQAGEGALLAANNLSDVADAAAALAAIGGVDQAAVDNAIAQAQLALGSNYSVEDIAARNALTGLTPLDRVFVKDDGDGKWANYQVGAVTEGEVTEWIKISDQDALENAISAPSIKAALLSNADTNVLTDAQLAKLEALNADAYLKTADLVQEIGAGAADEVPSAAAVAAYVASNSPEGLVPASESLVVDGSSITLANAPRGAAAGVLNFGTVRYVSSEGIAYDAPVVATANPLVYNISTDTADQWDGNTVQIQYLYVPA